MVLITFRLIFAFIAISLFSYDPHHAGAAAGNRQAVMATASSDQAEEDAHFSYPLRCLVRQFNFTATVSDANGRRCRGRVSTKACFGSCDSYEVGTFEFPWIVRVQPVCNYDKVVMKEVRLSDCDPGVDNGALVYRFPEASSCSCSICDPNEQTCETSPSKRSIQEAYEEPLRRSRRSSSQFGTAPSLKSYRPVLPARSQNTGDFGPIPLYDGRMSGWMAWSQLRRRRYE